MEVRAEKVEAFWRNGDDSLDLHSNVQFGEGGAGTFSDGKLNTLVKDVSGRNGKVLETFVEAGADGSILYDSRPHIGTDVLREVVKNIRKRIQDAGGEVRFGCRVEQVLMEDGRTGGVLLAGGKGSKAGRWCWLWATAPGRYFPPCGSRRSLWSPRPLPWA